MRLAVVVVRVVGGCVKAVGTWDEGNKWLLLARRVDLVRTVRVMM